MPAVCRVMVESRPSPTSLIRSVVWMPESWNGVLVGLGNGGVAGRLGEDYWSYAQKGYAAAQTDMGTSLVRSGERLTADAELWRDYAWRSTHLMTDAAKKLIECRYGKAPEYSYFIGASAGGLQAFSEVQRFPADYDGVIAGVPSNNTLNLGIYFLWLFVKMHTRDGKTLLPKEQAHRISLRAAEFFRQRGDGQEGDDFVSWPYADENTVRDFLGFLRKKEPQLTQPQFDALQAVYDGPRHARTGERIYCGLPIGAERNCGIFADAPDGRFVFPWIRLFFGEGFDDWDFDFADDYDAMRSAIGADFSAVSTDLTGFRDRGGRFLVYSGAADPMGPWADAVGYSNRVCARMGGFDAAAPWFRYFVLPGKAHGDTGLGVNRLWADASRTELLDAMRAWRERGVIPETLTGAHIEITDGREEIKFIRRIEPYRADRTEGKDFPPSTDDRFLGDV